MGLEEPIVYLACLIGACLIDACLIGACPIGACLLVDTWDQTCLTIKWDSIFLSMEVVQMYCIQRSLNWSVLAAGAVQEPSGLPIGPS